MEELIKEVLAFRDARNWKQFHNPKDLAISISLEAAELLELFQWSAEDTVVEEKRPDMKDELADVMMYCLLMADILHVDVEDIIREKMKKNEVKYEVSKAYGRRRNIMSYAEEKIAIDRFHGIDEE